MTTAMKKKTVPDPISTLMTTLTARGIKPTLTRESYQNLIDVGFRSKNLALAAVAAQVALHEKPLTLRGLMYRLVSTGWLPSTDKVNYRRLGRLLTTLREEGIVEFSWIVDSIRATVKPSSWAGLDDFVETVQKAYRKDFWTSLPEYVHIIVEKDAVAGTLEPVTRKYDVRLSPIRGYVSLSFANEIAEVWNRITKPIHCYYLGDFDASGFDLERDVRSKLERYCDNDFQWHRLGVNKADFADFDLIPLEAKKADTRYRTFIAEHGVECAEVDALPATELRRRVEEAILQHIPEFQWERLQETEAMERESFNAILGKLNGGDAA